jgi:acetyltransferase
MAASDLAVFFRPKGVAVIGASNDPGKLGHGVVRNLVQHGYEGRIYPVNPRSDEIMGLKVYASIADAPDPLDLAIVVVPAKLVETELEACGRRGVKGAVVVSGGFGELGEEGLARERELARIARRYQMALLGPNCIGTIDTHTRLNTTFVSGHPNPGEIAFLSQSGATVAAVIDWARGSGVGFSRLVSLGNQVDVTETAMLEAIADDDHTRLVATYIEGVSNGRAFLEAAAQVARNKPIVALKVGRGASGAKAVASHTGALAGQEAAYDAAFRRAGVLRAKGLEEMLDWACALAWQPLPNGNRVAVLTNSGGPGIMAVDALEAAGMQLAPLTEQTRAFLRQRVPAAASIQNPVDILAGSGPATYALCLDALLADENVDAVAVMTAPQDWFAPVSLAEVVGEVSNSPLGRRKPVLAVIMGLASTSEATHVLHRRRVPNFAFPERLGSTLAAMWQRRQWLDALNAEAGVSANDGDDAHGADSLDASDRAVLERMVADLTPESSPGGEAVWMKAAQVNALLEAYHIRTPRSGQATTLDQALAVAESLGYPVALKLTLPGLTHKTDIGGVALNLSTPDMLASSYRKMQTALGQHSLPPGVTETFSLQEMIQGEVEMIVGVVRDPQFGPLVMVGTGGTQVELMGDVTFELAPLTRRQAAEMLERTTAVRLLAGYRGKPPADCEAVIDVIVRLAQLAEDWPQISEIEINPLMVRAKGQGAVAVDARVAIVHSRE